MPRLLLLEDDSLLAKSLIDILSAATHSVEWASSLHGAQFYLQRHTYDLLIIDRCLADGDGLEIVRQLHAQAYQTKMLILSQKGQVEHRIEGLQAGADDYLMKPFSLTELVLRVEKLQSRIKTFDQEEIQIGRKTFYPQQGCLSHNGKKIRLRKREQAVLYCLCLHAHQVLSRSQIARWAWAAAEVSPTLKSIDTYITRLRKLLDSESDRLQTVRGYGYRLELRSGVQS